MLLVCDVGNTNLVFGLYEGRILKHSFRLGTDPTMTSDEYGVFVKMLTEEEGYKFSDIDDVIISSVVPEVMHSLDNFAFKFCKKKPYIVGPGIKTGINIKYTNPSQVGADRIVNATAGYEKYKSNLILIDFGTATTFCSVSKDGDYLGGLITPGIKISADALFLNASKLPKVEIKKPENVVAKNTVSAIQSGIYYGYLGLVDKIVSQMLLELGWKKGEYNIIATGGLSQLIVNESIHEIEVNKTLTLEGLRIIYEKNKQ